MNMHSKQNAMERAAYDAWLYKWVVRVALIGAACVVAAGACAVVAVAYGAYWGLSYVMRGVM